MRVTRVDTPAALADGRGHVRVRASVHLGRLQPADVRVKVTTAWTAPPSADRPTRLFSVQSYGNGTYVFEGLVPPEVVQAGDLAVRVVPGAVHETFSELDDVVRPFGIRPNRAREVHHSSRQRLIP